MSTTQLTTFSDLYTDLINRARVSSSVTATSDQAKRYINIALHDIHLGADYKFPWCERSFQLRTHAPYSTGTLTATTGLASFTGSGTAWNTTNSYGDKNINAHGKIIVNGTNDIYKVNLISSDTIVTLYTNFIGSFTTGASYTYFEDEYILPSAVLRPIDFQMFSPDFGVRLIPRNEFRRRYPVIRVSGRPQVACIIDSVTSGTNTTPVRRVVFYPYPDRVYLIPFTYVTANIVVSAAGVSNTSLVDDTDLPTMPLRYRHVIVLNALARWYRDRKDDTRADATWADYKDVMNRMLNDQDIATHMIADMRPGMGSYHRSAKTPYSSSAGTKVYDINNEFDSFLR